MAQGRRHLLMKSSYLLTTVNLDLEYQDDPKHHTSSVRYFIL